MPSSFFLRSTACLAVLGFAVLPISTVFAQDNATVSTDTAPSLLVTGTGEIMVKPDTAYVSLGVVSHGKEAAVVARQNATKTDAVIKALIKKGIAVADIHSEDYSLNAEYVDKNGTSIFTGYRVSNTVRVIVRKIASAGKTIDTALAAGANNINDIRFGLSDPQKAKDEAHKRAIADATRKAKLAAKAAGLGSIRLIELVSDAPLERGTGYYYAAKARMAGGYGRTPTSIQGGQQAVTATVTIRFGIVETPPAITTK
jgi:uncharacterized protein